MEPQHLSPTLTRLAADERAILELLAVFSDSVPMTPLMRAISRIGTRIKGRAPTNPDVQALLKRLVDRGVLQKESFAVPPALAHQVRKTLAQEGRFARLGDVVREVRPARTSGSDTIATWALAVRELRIDLYAERWEEVRATRAMLPRHIFHDVCQPFDPVWIASWPADIRSHGLAGIVEVATIQLAPAAEAFAMLAAEPRISDREHRVLIETLILRGQLDEAERRLEGHTTLEADVGRAFVAFLRGHSAQAIAAYEVALKACLKMAGKRVGFFPDRAGLFFIIALLADGSPGSLTRAAELVGAALRNKSLAFQRVFHMMQEVLALRAGHTDDDTSLLYIRDQSHLSKADPLEILIQVAAARWTQVKQPQAVRDELAKRRASAVAAGLSWYATQAADLLADGPRVEVAGVRLADLLAPRERWSETLDALLQIAAAPAADKPRAAATTSEPDRRLVWLVSSTGYGLTVEPREQSRSKGGWSKGKPVALKRLFEEGRQLGYLTQADLAACAAITSQTTYESYGRYARVYYTLDATRALRALMGSNNVLIAVADGTFEPCEIRLAAPRLEVERRGARLRVALVPRPPSDETTAAAVASGPQAVEIVEFTPVHHAIARALGKKPLDVPRSQEEKLQRVLGALSQRVAIHADLGGDAADANAVRGEARPCFVLRALGDGLSVAAHVRPLGAEGPLARPGEGGASLFAQVAGRPARASRDLAEETRRLEAALAACPVLAAGRSAGSDFVLPERDQALAVVLELRALGQDITTEWPDGEALQVTDPVELAQLQVTIRGEGGGFVLQGALKTGRGRADLELADLLDYLSASPSRFVQLGQGQEQRYLALSDELRQHLDEILGFGEPGKRGLRIPALTAPLVSDLLATAQVKADAGWQRQLERFAVSGKDAPVPSTLRGELRPYQLDGFRWLARLAQWGAGGCLADDMGLGKTVQVIALLLHRAQEGPALVVAPTSVVPTWVDEVQRFAPTLRVRTFAGAARDRELTDLGPFDLLITSYALLQLDIDALEQVAFATAVLDEAQAIKNAETKRARAAGRLRAQLRLATTGTPIENRLDDLRSIFAFINPGLLGSAQSFQARFARKVEREQDPVARDRLRRLVAPFVLRRSKTQVLPELPARTDVTLRVPLELEEMALYEVIRKEAVAALAADATGALPGRFQILAAIMRLRQAASNARLVLPESKAPSAKLAALGELLDDLLPNRHKVLIFSQFVTHLALVKAMLDERGVTYQYLDGSTPMATRKAAIDAFQGGQGEVFLISLKAGGFGLNLTAADYVVHMDPWWNPAVEDQASDRAHRIGQLRPVTVYRLVARDTIEDRILGLHHRKRDLAAGILAGSDLAGSMSEAELLDLIRGPAQGE